MNIAAMRVCAVLLTTATLSDCAIPVTADYNAHVGIDRCHTFTWQQNVSATRAGAFDNPINLQRLHAAIADALSARGVTLAADASQASCVVGAAIGVRTAAEDDFPSPAIAAGFGYGWGWRHGLFDLDFDDNYVYNEGSLSIDIYDATTHEPIWHAAARRDVTKLTGTRADADIREAVQALFARYPHSGTG